jgi:hypothetical protein
VRGEFPDDVSGPTAASGTSSGNSPRTPFKNPKTKNHDVCRGLSRTEWSVLCTVFAFWYKEINFVL